MSVLYGKRHLYLVISSVARDRIAGVSDITSELNESTLDEAKMRLVNQIYPDAKSKDWMVVFYNWLEGRDYGS